MPGAAVGMPGATVVPAPGGVDGSVVVGGTGSTGAAGCAVVGVGGGAMLREVVGLGPGSGGAVVSPGAVVVPVGIGAALDAVGGGAVVVVNDGDVGGGAVVTGGDPSGRSQVTSPVARLK